MLQSHFDCVGDDLRSTGGIPMKTRSRRRRSVEMASASSESRIIFARRLHSLGRLEGGGPLEERYEMMTSS